MQKSQQELEKENEELRKSQEELELAKKEVIQGKERIEEGLEEESEGEESKGQEIITQGQHEVKDAEEKENKEKEKIAIIRENEGAPASVEPNKPATPGDSLAPEERGDSLAEEEAAAAGDTVPEQEAAEPEERGDSLAEEEAAAPEGQGNPVAEEDEGEEEEVAEEDEGEEEEVAVASAAAAAATREAVKEADGVKTPDAPLTLEAVTQILYEQLILLKYRQNPFTEGNNLKILEFFSEASEEEKVKLKNNFKEELMNKGFKTIAAEIPQAEINELIKKIEKNISNTKQLAKKINDRSESEEGLTAPTGGKTLRKNKNRELINKAHKKKLKIW